jgi:F0F1-type ATP synthase membrane subunit c/vacuolar-type H+-ATPase subunit K
MPPQPNSPEAEYRFSLTLWVVMLISIGMYYVVIRMVTPEQPSDNPILVRILLVGSCGLAVASFAIRKLFESRARVANQSSIRRTGFLLALVLSEAAALFGLVVWFVTGSPQYYLFLLIGGGAMVLHFPTRPQ